jgi:hypothetical protein
MSAAVRLSALTACQTCFRFSRRSGCILLRFWREGRYPGKPAGHVWLKYIPTAEHPKQHTLAALAHAYRVGDRNNCPAHREVNR